MVGVLINVAAVLAGGLLGLALGKRVPQHLRDTVMQGLGFACSLSARRARLQRRT